MKRSENNGKIVPAPGHQAMKSYGGIKVEHCEFVILVSSLAGAE
jgi:hypothetical protein